ncbi:hypoxanthine phosphoribosyltransferase [Clostridium botulinum]|uniref:Hypoxanthine phosphoribosyltransferase n=1 Tax=Clostridium botulinum TaxID=1491 RepID=A0A6M0SKP9_CLOBO|nr:hypoxanthine phosphoribosyltransferase [Clostridium botulinum]NFA41801.1 hypoxanthine phosphoribosyltransferase [Clostridium botulinum]
MREDIQEILFDEETLNKKIKEIAEKISVDYKGRELVVVGILKGSVLFAAELIKNISIPCEIDFMAVSSYGNSTETSGVVRILKDLDYSIEGKDILLVEDIVDSGVTLSYLLKYLKARKANTIEIVSLLNKSARRKAEVYAKYIGFEVPDAFIVGYGIDYAEKYRNLPFIGVLKPGVYEK